MFYEVRILDRKGHIKKVLSSKDLSKRYWDGFESHFGQTTSQPKKKGLKTSRRQKVPYRKRNENLEFTDLSDGMDS